MAEERANNLNEEIKALEQILREKKRELETKGLAPASVEEEKKILKEAVKEHIERAAEAMPPSAPSGVQDIVGQVAVPPSPTPSDQAQDDPLAGLDHRDQIEELATIAFSKGIVEAVNTARRTNNPHLLDEFHDALVDRLYDYLVQEGVIERPK